MDASDSKSSVMPSKAYPSIPPPLSLTDYLKMMSGPRVNIYVGEQRKQYTFPKDLLCYYSPYFDACFREGSFAEGKTGKLDLPAVNVDDFELLMNSVLRNVDPKIPTDPPCNGLRHCFRLLSLADQFCLPILCAHIIPTLKDRLDEEGSKLRGADIELIYHLAPKGHDIRSLIANAVASLLFRRNGSKNFDDQLELVDGFAADVVKAARKKGCQLR